MDGTTLGFRHSAAGRPDGKIVQIAAQAGATGPAENAYVFVDLAGADGPRGHYLAWVNLYDIEYAGSLEPGRWSLCEPPQPCACSVDWRPYGWGAARFPNVAYQDGNGRSR